MNVSEIFNSIEGEGKRAGLPATFIRLFGCNLRCSYCDSMYAVCGNDYTEMSIEEIIETVDQIGCPNITITGGEPLMHPQIEELLSSLCNKGFWVNVETNGSMKLPYRAVDGRLFYTVDYKTSSSDMNQAMKQEVFDLVTDIDVIKFVVGTQRDLKEALAFSKKLASNAQIFLSPVFNKIKPEALVEFVLSNKLWDWKVQLQLHKFIWDPNMKGV